MFGERKSQTWGGNFALKSFGKLNRSYSHPNNQRCQENGLPVQQPKKFELVYKFEGGQADRPHDSAECAGASRQGH
jgi:hypothetical protein